MSTALEEVREKIHAVEDALRGSGYDSRLVSPGIEDAGIKQAHRAIVDCFKAIAAGWRKWNGNQAE